MRKCSEADAVCCPGTVVVHFRDTSFAVPAVVCASRLRGRTLSAPPRWLQRPIGLENYIGGIIAFLRPQFCGRSHHPLFLILLLSRRGFWRKVRLLLEKDEIPWIDSAGFIVGNPDAKQQNVKNSQLNGGKRPRLEAFSKVEKELRAVAEKRDEKAHDRYGNRLP